MDGFVELNDITGRMGHTHGERSTDYEIPSTSNVDESGYISISSIAKSPTYTNIPTKSKANNDVPKYMTQIAEFKRKMYIVCTILFIMLVIVSVTFGFLTHNLMMKTDTAKENSEEVKSSIEETQELKADVAGIQELKADVTELQTLKAKMEDLELKFEEEMNTTVEETNDLKAEVADIQELKADAAEIQALKAKIEDLEIKYDELQWEDWSPWGQCSAHCQDGVGERLQFRTRNKKNSTVSDTSSQTESRPCNSVQFAGCISPQNGDRFFAIAYDYQHVLAQFTCTAMSPVGRVNAVKRTCTNQALDCNDVCRKLAKTCFNALHVYESLDWVTPLELPVVEQESLEIHKYNSCSDRICGPNFCCCIS